MHSKAAEKAVQSHDTLQGSF